jgi:hypothetical protein
MPKLSGSERSRRTKWISVDPNIFFASAIVEAQKILLILSFDDNNICSSRNWSEALSSTTSIFKLSEKDGIEAIQLVC